MPDLIPRRLTAFRIIRLRNHGERLVHSDRQFALVGPDGLVWHTSWTPANLRGVQRELNAAYELGCLGVARRLTP